MHTDGLPPRVLLIDDDPVVLSGLATLLRKAGHTVAEAESGSAGLASFRENPADIVLTDFTLPDLTGWDVARTVKAINPRVPVVYVTGRRTRLPRTSGPWWRRSSKSPVD